MHDQKLFSAEQIDFLDKFFKENPWADNAPIESIVKATGLTESIIKVTKKSPKHRKEFLFYFSRLILINVGQNGIRCIHQIIIIIQMIFQRIYQHNQHFIMLINNLLEIIQWKMILMLHQHVRWLKFGFFFMGFFYFRTQWTFLFIINILSNINSYFFHSRTCIRYEKKTNIMKKT